MLDCIRHLVELDAVGMSIQHRHLGIVVDVELVLNIVEVLLVVRIERTEVVGVVFVVLVGVD